MQTTEAQKQLIEKAKKVIAGGRKVKVHTDEFGGKQPWFKRLSVSGLVPRAG